jgi:type IV pilus assembly protein PilA
VRLIHSLKARRDREDGFTLIELMVVVLIIAILIAIAIPAFLGARERAQNRAAQSDLRNAHTAAKTFYTDDETYMDTDAATTAGLLDDIEPSLVWEAAATPTDDDRVAIQVSDNVFCATKTSKAGTTYVIADVATGVNAGTYYDDGGTCTVVEATIAGWATTPDAGW